jgi:hypothetical protein
MPETKKPSGPDETFVPPLSSRHVKSFNPIGDTVTMADGTTTASPTPASLTRTAVKRKRKTSGFLAVFLWTATLTMATLGLAAAWFYLTPAGTEKRNVLADTIIATQHRDLAKYLIGSRELGNRVDAYWKRFDQYASAPVQQLPSIPAKPAESKPLVQIEPIQGKGFKGYLMSVSDPTWSNAPVRSQP